MHHPRSLGYMDIKERLVIFKSGSAAAVIETGR